MNCFLVHDVTEEQLTQLDSIVPEWLISNQADDQAVSFMLHGGNEDSRLAIWQSVHFFCQHTATTPMPAGIVYPGLIDPGVNVALPLTYSTFQGLIHFLACLSIHPSGAPARGAATTVDITVQGQPTFSVTV